MTMNLKSTPALLLIDVQQAFDEAYWGKRNNPQAETVIANLLARWRQNNWPVIHIRHCSTEANSSLRADRPGNAYKPEAQPLPDEIEFCKAVNSSFIGTGLDDYLRQQGLLSLVIVGISTDHCVSTTVRMAGNLGYQNFLVEDGCFSFDRTDRHGKLHSAQSLHEAHLASLDKEFCTVISSAELISQLFAESENASS